jgi:hypothetical protein
MFALFPYVGESHNAAGFRPRPFRAPSHVVLSRYPDRNGLCIVGVAFNDNEARTIVDRAPDPRYVIDLYREADACAMPVSTIRNRTVGTVRNFYRARTCSLVQLLGGA